MCFPGTGFPAHNEGASKTLPVLNSDSVFLDGLDRLFHLRVKNEVRDRLTPKSFWNPGIMNTSTDLLFQDKLFLDFFSGIPFNDAFRALAGYVYTAPGHVDDGCLILTV